jgi:chromosome segregation ATPase
MSTKPNDMKKAGSDKLPKEHTMKTSTRTFNLITYILLAVLVFLLIWSMFSEHKQLERINSLNQEKSTLVQELSNLKRDYQMVKSLEEDYEEQIEEDQNRIDRLIREVKFKSNNIEEYRTEISGLQQKLENYLLLVDSMKTTMQEQTKESRDKIADLLAARDSLASKIKKASRLHAYSLDVMVENKRGKRTMKPNRVQRVRICFTLAQNIFLEEGNKNIYLRILRPDERLIYASPTDLFEANGQELGYTAKAKVDYENVDTRVCITWENIKGDLDEGLYYVNIYTDGYEIGSRSFLLDKGFLFF